MHTIVQHHGVFPSAESRLSHKQVQGKIVAYNCSLCLLSVLFRSRLCLSQTLHSLAHLLHHPQREGTRIKRCCTRSSRHDVRSLVVA